MIVIIFRWGLGIGDWGLGIGDWGLGIGPNPQSPIPNPQSPNPQSPIPTICLIIILFINHFTVITLSIKFSNY